MIKVKIVTSVEVVDPDTGDTVEVVIYKLENGTMIGADDFTTLRGVVVEEDEPNLTEQFKPTGTLCSVCNEPQFTTPHGEVCENGHGGAKPKAPPPLPKEYQ